MGRELEFERPVRALDRQIEALKRLSGDAASGEERSRLEVRIRDLEARASSLTSEVFRGLSRWQIVQLARHPERPYTLDFVGRILTEFEELHGDRAFGDDPALVGGIGRLRGRPIVVVGHQKGRTTSENVHRNFGMPRPEGYRKAMRLMDLAARFDRPLLTLIDTAGAYPGLDAEERGQAQAIAECLEKMASLPVPVVSVVIGEGGSGGALAIGVANEVLMLSHATYSVISPEGCASILFKDAGRAPEAADALRLTAPDLLGMGVVDRIVEEPVGGAHRDPDAVAAALGRALVEAVARLSGLGAEALRAGRYARFRKLGSVVRPPV